eukprot:324969_1
MSSFGSRFDEGFHLMKSNLARNAPSKDDRIPIGSEYRLKLLMQHEFTVNYYSKEQEKVMVSLQTNSDALSCKHLCTKHENELKNAFISNLLVNEINFGKKLNVRVISKCV